MIRFSNEMTRAGGEGRLLGAVQGLPAHLDPHGALVHDVLAQLRKDPQRHGHRRLLKVRILSSVLLKISRERHRGTSQSGLMPIFIFRPQVHLHGKSPGMRRVQVAARKRRNKKKRKLDCPRRRRRRCRRRCCCSIAQTLSRLVVATRVLVWRILRPKT